MFVMEDPAALEEWMKYEASILISLVCKAFFLDARWMQDSKQ